MASAIPVTATSIKSIAEAFNNGHQNCAIPSNYRSSKLDPLDKDEVDEKLSFSIPVIDYSLLTSHDPQVRAQTVKQLGDACAQWSVFMIINHGIPESLMEGALTATRKFFEMSDEEKQPFINKGVFDPVRYGTSFSANAEDIHFWRDYFKIYTHPQFCSPDVFPGFRDTTYEYFKEGRKIVEEVYKGMSKSLGLEENAIAKALEYEKDVELIVANLYPPCPDPEAALGLPPHSDNSSIVLLTQNGISGLQVHHNGKWANVNPPPNGIIVIVGDQIEIATNGKYRGALHRATLNNKVTRVSLTLDIGPAFDKLVEPIPELVENGKKPRFRGITYREYYTLHQTTKLQGKSKLDHVRIHLPN